MSNKVTVLKSGKKNYPYYVSFPDGGERKKKYFKTKGGKDGADAWAVAKRKKLTTTGSKHATVTDAEMQAVVEFRDVVSKLPEHAQDVTLADAVKNFTKGLEARHRSISCQDVADKLVGQLMAEGKSKSHRDTLECRLNRFNLAYGDWLACDVSVEVIDDFLGHLKVGGQTKLHYRRAIGQMFNHAIKLKAAPSNPTTDAIKPKVTPAATGILKPGQSGEAPEPCRRRHLAGACPIVLRWGQTLRDRNALIGQRSTWRKATSKSKRPTQRRHNGVSSP